MVVAQLEFGLYWVTATTPSAIREHAQRVGMPADEITPIANTVIVRADPAPEAKAA